MKIQEIVSFPMANESIYKKNELNDEKKSLLKEIAIALKNCDLSTMRTKVSREKTSAGKLLISPKSINKSFKENMISAGWQNGNKYEFEYDVGKTGAGWREIDFYKNRVGCEIQLGKYAYGAWDSLKIANFVALGIIDIGVLLMPSKELQSNMSSGVGCFEMIVEPLKKVSFGYPLIVVSIG